MNFESVEKPGFEILGIKFAPLNTPLRRRWQTLCLLFYITPFFVGLPLYFIMAYVLLFTQYWYFVLLYICWFIYDRKSPFEGGRRSPFFQYSRFGYGLKDYFPSKLIKTADLPDDKNYLLCCYPHGVLCFGVVSNFVTGVNFKKEFPDLNARLIMLDSIFNVPYLREMLLATGIIGCSKESIRNALKVGKKGTCLELMVGGASEAYFADPGANKIILNNRKGFIRIALETGTAIVPVYTFGENYLFRLIKPKWTYKIQEKLRRHLGVLPIMLNGRGIFQYSFGLLPHRFPITTVVGKPILVPKVENPTEERIKEFHEIYRKELTQLFEEYKVKYDPQGSEAKLEII